MQTESESGSALQVIQSLPQHLFLSSLPPEDRKDETPSVEPNGVPR